MGKGCSPPSQVLLLPLGVAQRGIFMVSHFKRRIIPLFIFGLLDFGHAIAADKFIIRGDQSRSLLHEVPLPLKALPDWFFEGKQSDTDEQLKNLLADVEFFTRSPETEPDLKKQSNEAITNKQIFTPAIGASP